MTSWLASLTQRIRRSPKWSTPLAPDKPFIAIGDIHGRVDCLHALSKMLDKTYSPDIQRVFLGDYIDRGDDSAAVLRLLFAQQATTTPPVCLLGNHEEMLLQFLKYPQEDGSRWMRHGGTQTLISFGVNVPESPVSHTALVHLRDELADAMGPDLIKWLELLPRHWSCGNIILVHAGMDPSLPFDLQKSDVLIWGHPQFGKDLRQDALWVIHGHTIVEKPIVKNGVISIDTGAYLSGNLTAAYVNTAHVEFQQS